MSRIGKSPIPIPDGIKVNVANNLVEVSSADGKKKLTQEVSFVSVSVVEKEVLSELSCRHLSLPGPLGGKCPLELAGYEVHELPIAQICRGHLLGWPTEVWKETVLNG